MNKFEAYFKNLYDDNHNSISKETKNEYINMADHINITSTHPKLLNKPITVEEVTSAINSLKSGKASSIDMVSNEILKNLDSQHRNFLTNHFNVCFDTNVYPWTENIITLLHKKGEIKDPDNYRAIAISSVIGKLFSTILLERLKSYRNKTCPDPPNQLGFTKGAQTYDHILTMHTIISKYKKIKKPVFAIFVDFKKAFDSVCRQALFYKMAKLGITGKFYDILRNLYSNSSAYIKLSSHISNKFDIAKGTEQGHPLSPDLFKIFLSDLSPLLDFIDCPILSEKLISHLLWADDLIMLSLSSDTCQRQLEILDKFCCEWGLEVNELKTKVMVIGGDKNNKANYDQHFKLQDKYLKLVDSYCYLGIILHDSGNFKEAQTTLKIKSMRAFFGLKRTVIRSKLSFKALTTLFDALIKPIILYGAPIWTPNSAINKSIIKFCHSQPFNVQKFISKINRDPTEKIHLSFLKWAIGVHRKASNIGVWGETGRYPLIYQSIRLTLNYYKRLLRVPKNSFVHAAFNEQKSMKLPWYKNIEPLLKLDEIYHLDHVSAYNFINKTSNKYANNNGEAQDTSSTKPLPNHLSNLEKAKPLPSKKFRVQNIINNLNNHFMQCWEYEKSISTKLTFYHLHKLKFARETYIDNIKGFSRRYSTTKLRISSHDLEIERGRYTNTPKESRICNWCHTSMGESIIENENHLMFECDLYASQRAKLISRLNSLPETCTNSQHNLPLNLNIDITTLKTNFMTLLSPFTTPDINTIPISPFNSHHKLLCKYNKKFVNSETESLIFRRSYIINCLSTFIYQALEKRQKYMNNVHENEKNMNTFVLKFNQL